MGATMDAMARDDLDRGLKRLTWEQEPAAQARKTQEMKALLLQGEMRANRRKLEAAGYPEMEVLDTNPYEFWLTVRNWLEGNVLEVLIALPHVRQVLIDLDQEGAFRDKRAVEMAMSDMAFSLRDTKPWDWDGGEWRYDRETYGQEEE